MSRAIIECEERAVDIAAEVRASEFAGCYRLGNQQLDRLSEHGGPERLYVTMFYCGLAGSLGRQARL